MTSRFHAYTSCSMILYSIGQKQLCGLTNKESARDFPLVETCLRVLSYCGQVDFVARKFHGMIWPSFGTIKAHSEELARRDRGPIISTELAISNLLNLNTPPDLELRSITNPRRFFTVPQGDSAVHEACRDLLKMIQRPFGREYLERSANTPRALPLTEGADWRFEIPTPFNWQNTDWFAWTVAEEQERNALEVLTSMRATERKRKAISKSGGPS